MKQFAVIDTETNWQNEVMSIGTIIADAQTFKIVDAKYHIFPKECKVGGMYCNVLLLDMPVKPICCTRSEAMRDLCSWFERHLVNSIFAYNAAFDRNLLPELNRFTWYDIMRFAAYRQYNSRIPASAECYSTGRLKRGYGVEGILRMLTGNCTYQETHNAYYDAIDELEIIRLLGYGISQYKKM